MPQAYVDQEECIGCESCVQICEQVFVMNGENKAECRPEATGTEECIQEAMDTCPVECIHWQD